MKLRGLLAVATVGIFLVLSDVIQRTVVHGLVVLLPSRRDRILGRWQRWIAHVVLGLVERVGGARTGDLPRIPGRPGVLVLMNHQSLLDIPLVVAAVDDLYPRIVTRARYARGKPLISHMVRLYQYPVVEPRATSRHQVESLHEAARASPVPLVLYPEGTRTRDGSLAPFRPAGLARLLAARRWEVYLFVIDGFWQAATLADFVDGVGRVRGRLTLEGPFASPEPDADPGAFVDDMRGRMVAALERLRVEASHEAETGEAA